MKIAYLSNAGSVHFIRWYEYFLKKGHKVYLISGNPSLLKYRIDIRALKVYYLPEFKISNRIVSFGVNLLNFPRLFSRLKRLLKDISPDIIHAHQVYPYGFWGALYNFHPFVVTPIGSDVVILANKYYIYGKITEFVLKKADLVTGDSLVLKENCKKFGLKEGYQLIQNGVDLNRFSFEGDGRSSKIREKHGVDETAPLIFYARGFTPLYNVDKIIKAIPLVLKKIPDCKFIMAHHFGEMEKGLKKMVHNLKLNNSVIFTGLIQHEEMPFYFKASNLFISVPSSDNSPSSVYEAMACGIPTIISDLPWAKYAMKHRYNTFIINEVSPRTISDAVIQLLTDNALKKQIVKGGLDTVKQYFCYHENMKKMEDLMIGLVKSYHRCS